MARSFAAVDLGASSGRVMVAAFDAGGVELHEVHRFANRPVRVHGTLHWDALALWGGVLDGLRIAARTGALSGIGVDSWAVDYALLDADGALLAATRCTIGTRAPTASRRQSTAWCRARNSIR
jgi:rhamnulokinase